MAPKFDQLIPRYAILILRYAIIARGHTFSFISRRIRNKIRKYFTAWIRGLHGIVWWKKNQRSKILWYCPFIRISYWHLQDSGLNNKRTKEANRSRIVFFFKYHFCVDFLNSSFWSCDFIMLTLTVMYLLCHSVWCAGVAFSLHRSPLLSNLPRFDSITGYSFCTVLPTN
jgi:hypothetical protein